MCFQCGYCVYVGLPCALTFKLFNRLVNISITREWFSVNYCVRWEAISLFPMKYQTRLGRYWLSLELVLNVVLVSNESRSFLHRLSVDFPENILIELIYKSSTFLIINPTSVSALVSLEPLFRGTFPRVSALPECAGVGKCFPQRHTGKILGQILSKWLRSCFVIRCKFFRTFRLIYAKLEVFLWIFYVRNCRKRSYKFV